MARKGSHHKVVYNSQDWTLAWPRDHWLALSEEEQKDVITRQTRLIGRLKRKMARRERSKQEMIANV